ncbi:MAG: HAD family hydrolase [SAR324 cluster bacterium]|uniref:HAD family hydrolase n=1 Tax=SAR324 cluster bacterium TaxID=2024889 RepID=A0A7X9IL15_9DELT|nr:HAD family hydrolase [SAR324 cluster bacterium]
MKNRNEALALLKEYTKSDSLIKHGLSVEAAMKWYAEKHFQLSKSEIEKWGIVGLLHDFDYEMYPDLTAADHHPVKGCQILRDLNYPDDLIEAIMGHADYTDVPRETPMAKTLYAVDELSGLVFASVLVRPDKSLYTIEASSVKKKMKDKAFARGCNRDEILRGAEELGVDFMEHIKNVIDAMRVIAPDLGLAG